MVSIVKRKELRKDLYVVANYLGLGAIVVALDAVLGFSMGPTGFSDPFQKLITELANLSAPAVIIFVIWHYLNDRFEVTDYWYFGFNKPERKPGIISFLEFFWVPMIWISWLICLAVLSLVFSSHFTDFNYLRGLVLGPISVIAPWFIVTRIIFPQFERFWKSIWPYFCPLTWDPNE